MRLTSLYFAVTDACAMQNVTACATDAGFRRGRRRAVDRRVARAGAGVDVLRPELHVLGARVASMMPHTGSAGVRPYAARCRVKFVPAV